MEHGIETGVLTDVLLPLALAIIMFGMGMTLTLRDFTRLVRIPLSATMGLTGQIVALPLLAILVAVVFHHAFGFNGTLVLGLLLLACVPGGPTSNLLTFLARGDVALSVTLTAIVTLAGVLLVPLLFFAMTSLLFDAAQIVRVSFIDMALLVLMILVVPVGLGMLVRRVGPRFARAAERPVRIVSIGIFFIVVAGVVIANRNDFWLKAGRTVPAVLALNVLALAAGVLLARAARLPMDQRRTLAFEVGFQNGTLGITIAVVQLGNPEAALVPGFYGLVMFLTGGVLAWWWSRTPASTPDEPEAAGFPHRPAFAPLVVVDEPRGEPANEA